ncbi:glycosyltransferase [Enterovirga sp.]|uniref:glycosyltransferase family protein n=1 Tax=Enterovirga sp. TaxID=2026350 RepID=UPI002CBDF864|nr:glycosyltransferase [Enterovirga sp.]HMO28952.1 glycosyltransferase [Enterovirga sp.]
MSLRILIAVTHLLGAGHLVRASAIGRALARRGHHVTLASGGAPMPLADASGLDLVQLPPVRAPLGDFSVLLGEDGQPAGPAYLDRRRRLLLATFARLRPHVVVTEQFPFGRRNLAGEFQALLDAAAAQVPPPVLLGSVRDILVAPAKPEKIERAHALVARRYAAILVHGDEAVVPLGRSWPVDEALRRKLAYTGYVGPGEAAILPAGPDDGSILVSGGSSAAALPLYRAALAAARLDASRPWRVLVGSAVEEEVFRQLLAEAPPGAAVERARRDFRSLLARAAVFVGQAGYNTVMDIVATRARAVLVPFELGQETEQRLRAECLAGEGLATLLPEAELTPQNLLAAVAAAASRPRPAFAIGLDGQERSADLVETFAAARTGSGAESAQ